MHDLSLYLLELLENAVRAGATTVVTTIVADRGADRLTLAVEDDGPGLPVPPGEVLDPFFTTKQGKKTGLGLSLFLQEAEGAGGGLSVCRSGDLGGVAVRAWMGLSHLDRPPLGDIAQTLVTMAAVNPDVTFVADLAAGDERLRLDGGDVVRRRRALAAFQGALAWTPSTGPAAPPAVTRLKETR